MLNINFSNLNALESQIHEKLKIYSQTHANIKITEAAVYCDCSVSKISKFVKKLGFTNYKQYIDFLYGREVSSDFHSDEINRIKKFIDTFDESKVDELAELIGKHDKIVLFGYGPSQICAQYFEYRLRTCTNKLIIAVADEISVASLTNDSTLLILLTVTGKFQTFENIYRESKAKGCDVAIVVEEFNADLFHQCDKIFCLTDMNQPEHLLPYEKSRTVFFIFFEEIIQKFMRELHKIDRI